MPRFSDNELRHMAIGLMKAPTARDAQSKIGASNLSNGCDFCLASNLRGDMRETPMLDRAFMGRTLGTAQHGILEERMNRAQMLFAARNDDVGNIANEYLRRIAEAFPGAESEVSVAICEIDGYGTVGGHIDLDLNGQIVDWKGSTRKKSLVLQDYLRIAQGLDAFYGRTHKDVKLSEAKYAEEIEAQEFKVTGYYGQQTLYMHGNNLRGKPTTDGSLIFFNRDGTGWFDNPSESRYDDPTAVHDVWVMSFQYSEAYALALIQRGQDIWNHLAAGGIPGDYASHKHCFPCGLTARPSAPVNPAADVALAA